MSATQRDYYSILGVIDSAEMVVIKAAYKALMMVYHPDRYEGDTEEAIRKTKEINEAYAVLIDPEKRKQYTHWQSTTKTGFESNQDTEDNNLNIKDKELEPGWLIAIELVKGLDDLYQNLNVLSKELAFSFKQKILESKRFDEVQLIAENLESDYIKKFFGANKDIQNFSRWLLSTQQRAAAKEINKLVAQTNDRLNSYQTIETIIKKYQLTGFEMPVRTRYKLGDILDDNSVVFYVDASSHHGLAASREDLSIKATWHEAKKLTGNHPFDWHLPNRDELNLLYEQRDLVGDFANHLYWSSTEIDSFNAWFHNFYIGKQFTGNKNLSHRVRTIREF
jgi:curved DNA-binding protein CbpA